MAEDAQSSSHLIHAGAGAPAGRRLSTGSARSVSGPAPGRLLRRVHQVHGPGSSVLAEPLEEHEEGILYADLDFSLIAIAKSAADPVGHHSRLDVVRLLLNRSPSPVVVDRAPLAVLDELPAPAGD